MEDSVMIAQKKSQLILCLLFLLCCSFVSELFAQTIHPLPVTHNDYPRRLGQTEWLKPDYPATWTSTSTVLTTLYLWPGTSPYIGQSAMLHPSVWSNPSYILPDPVRYAYSPNSSLAGTISFFMASYNAANQEYAVSDILGIDLDRPILGPVTQATCSWDNYVPTPPVPLNLTTGHVWVDANNGLDSNTGLTQAQAVQTLGRGVQVLKSLGSQVGNKWIIPGKIMIIRGGDYRYRNNSLNSLNLTNIEGLPGQPVIIAGYGNETPIIDGFQLDFEALVASGNPFPQTSAYYSQNIYGPQYGITMKQAKHMIVENLTVMGFNTEGVDPDNVEDVMLRFLHIHNIGDWGIQAFGTIKDFVIEGCVIQGISMGTRAEHCIYIAGKDATYNPATGMQETNSHNIRLSYNFMQHAPSHGIHINGTQYDVMVNNNRIMQVGMAGLQSTGTTNLRVYNNVFAETMRFAICLFTDYDHTYWPTRKGQDVLDWQENHYQAIGDIDIAYNTFYVPQNYWMTPMISSGPDDFDTIRISECSGYIQDDPNDPNKKVEALVEPFFNVKIRNNIAMGQRTSVVKYDQSLKRDANNVFVNEHCRVERMMEGISFYDNIFYATGGTTRFWGPMDDKNSVLKTLMWVEQNYPAQWYNNEIDQNPLFVNPLPVLLIPLPTWWPSHSMRLFNSDYTLQAASPGVDRGTSPHPPIDIYNIARPLGNGPDIGAHESH